MGLTVAMTRMGGASPAARRRSRGLRGRVEDVFLEGLEGDFLGVQCYTGQRVGPDGPVEAPAEVERTQMGYEFQPEALEPAIRRAAEVTGLPVLVTENGLGTDDDTRRVEFIERALRGVEACLRDGIDVRGYFYWSLFDNFEWVFGYRPTFGLVAVDRATQDALRQAERPPARRDRAHGRPGLGAVPAAQRADGPCQRIREEQRVRVGDGAVALGEQVPPVGNARRQRADGLAGRGRRREHALDGRRVQRVAELARDPSEVVRSKWPIQSRSMPSTAAISWAFSAPAAVSICAISNCSRLAVREAGGEPVRHVVGVVDADAARAERWEARELGELPRLLCRLRHRDHHADCPEVERPRDEVALRPGDAHERRHAASARCRQELAHRLDAPAGVLHVEEDEVGAGRCRQPRHAARRELEAHESGERATVGQQRLERVVAHRPQRTPRLRAVGRYPRRLPRRRRCLGLSPHPPSPRESHAEPRADAAMTTPLRDPARVDAEIDALAESSFAFLERLVAEPSTLGGEAGAQAVVAAELERIGFAVELLEVPEAIGTDTLAGVPQLSYAGRPVVVGRLAAGDGPTLLCNAHVDVVPAETPERWSTGPFTPTRRDGWLYGRGAGDMKCGFAMVLLAVEALRRAEPGAIGGTLAFVSAIEEECTGNGTLAALRAGVLGDAVVLPEPTGLEILVGGSGVLWCDFAVSGRAGHAHDAQSGANPILACLALVDALRALEIELNAARGEGEEHCAINVGTISGGDWRSSSPTGARLGVRVGFPAEWDVAAAQRAVREALERATSAPGWPAGRERDAQLRRLPRGRLRASIPEHALVRSVADAHEAVHGNRPQPFRLASTTDARHYLNELAMPGALLRAAGAQHPRRGRGGGAREHRRRRAHAHALHPRIHALRRGDMPTIRANGLDLAYQIDGDGPETLVLVNGLADTKESWEAQVPAFAERYRVDQLRQPRHRRVADTARPVHDGADGRRPRRARRRARPRAVPPARRLDGRDDRPGVRDRPRRPPALGGVRAAPTPGRARSACACSSAGASSCRTSASASRSARSCCGRSRRSSSSSARTSCRGRGPSMAANPQPSSRTWRSCSRSRRTTRAGASRAVTCPSLTLVGEEDLIIYPKLSRRLHDELPRLHLGRGAGRARLPVGVPGRLQRRRAVVPRGGRAAIVGWRSPCAGGEGRRRPPSGDRLGAFSGPSRSA